MQRCYSAVPADTPIGAPGSLLGVPRDVTSPLVLQELENVRNAPDRPITRDRALLQYLPPGYFNTPGGKAALERLVQHGYADCEQGRANIADYLLGIYNPPSVGRGAPAVVTGEIEDGE